MDYTFQNALAAFNAPTTDSIISGDNAGSNLDFSSGVKGGVTLVAPTGNSLLDAIGKTSALAVNTISAGLAAYSSFLETKAVSDAAKRLNTTPAQITGAISTVPLTNQSGNGASSQQWLLYAGGAALAAVVIVKLLK